ncbi:MAG: hypothetical protein ABH865_08400 [Candidatus Omnitrophota bacterium]
MKKFISFFLLSFLLFGCAFAAEEPITAPNAPAQPAPVSAPTKVILLISEQNIEGPQRAWWASQIDLSTSEATITRRLIEQGYEVLDASVLSTVIKQKPAFQVVEVSDEVSFDLGVASGTQYVIAGKAVATAGGNVPQSEMVSCFANITAKVIRVSDRKIVQYVDASGSSIHMDVITGGREALAKASEALAQKIVEALNRDKQGGN